MVPLLLREQGERVLAAGAVLEQHGAALRLAEGEDLEGVPRAVPVRIGDGEPDRDARALLDELRRLEAQPVSVVLLEKVHDLPAVASGRRLPVHAAARNAEPLRVLREELPERAHVPGVERGERLLELLAHQSWMRAIRSRRGSTFWLVPPSRTS